MTTLSYSYLLALQHSIETPEPTVHKTHRSTMSFLSCRRDVVPIAHHRSGLEGLPGNDVDTGGTNGV